jgi:hypothetical protein
MDLASHTALRCDTAALAASPASFQPSKAAMTAGEVSPEMLSNSI